MNDLLDPLAALPLIAILRGLLPENAEAVGWALFEAGFRVIEVPLNSPRPFESLAALAKAFNGQALIGAGTVVDRGDVVRVLEAGAKLVVMPHADASIIAAAKACRLYCIPGVATPSEGFAALAAGADALKLFPAETIPPAAVKAWRAVFPADTQLIPVGGITPEKIADYRSAGASALGLGSALFTPGLSIEQIRQRADRFVAACRSPVASVHVAAS
jgi:2-dehydro-3-deoxyphosphogalactonate aldolase